MRFSTEEKNKEEYGTFRFIGKVLINNWILKSLKVGLFLFRANSNSITHSIRYRANKTLCCIFNLLHN